MIQLSRPLSLGPAKRNCRACLRCRSKKVKCDAEQPKCFPCSSAGADCTYPPDARRSERASKAEVRALRAELSILRRLVNEKGIGYPITEEVGELLRADQSHDGNLGSNSGGQEEFPRPSPREQHIEGALSPGVNHGQLQEHAAAILLHPSPSSLAREQHISYRGTPLQSTPPFHRGPINSPKGVESNESIKQGPLSSEAYIAGAMTEDGHVHVHGITSTLHQPAAVEVVADFQQDFEDENECRAQMAAEHLISNAATQRQREIAALSSPNVGNRVDFDGLEPEIAIHLLDLHWNRHHLGYMYTYRPAVMDSLINGGLYANKLLLNAIYYASSLFSDRVSLRSDPQDPQTQGDRFYLRFKRLLVDEIDKPSIPSANALLLCGSSLVSHGKQSAGWLLCGLAYRMVTDLGCHLSVQDHSRESSEISRSSLMAFEIRRRLYWGAFIMDKFQSLYLGRPPALRLTEARVSKILHDTYEELDLWAPYVDQTNPTRDFEFPAYQPKPAFAVSTFQSLAILAEISSRIVESFYSMESIRIPRDVCLQTKSIIENDLDEWQRRLPQHLHFEPNVTPTPPPHQITPHTTYWTLLILLERPFLSTGHLRSLSDETSQVIGAKKCSTAVHNIWNLVKAYKDAFTLRRAPYLLSYAIYSAVLVILHQTGDDNTRFVGYMPFFWTALLDLQDGSNFGLKKPIAILKALMQRLGKNMACWDSTEDERRTLGNEFWNAGADDIGLSSEFLQNTDYDLWTNPYCLDSITGDQALTEDSMYGIFTSR